MVNILSKIKSDCKRLRKAQPDLKQSNALSICAQKYGYQDWRHAQNVLTNQDTLESLLSRLVVDATSMALADTELRFKIMNVVCGYINTNILGIHFSEPSSELFDGILYSDAVVNDVGLYIYTNLSSKKFTIHIEVNSSPAQHSSTGKELSDKFVSFVDMANSLANSNELPEINKFIVPYERSGRFISESNLEYVLFQNKSGSIKPVKTVFGGSCIFLAKYNAGIQPTEIPELILGLQKTIMHIGNLI